MQVTEYLIKHHGFDKYRNTREHPYGVDLDQFTAWKRIGEVHYLMYSENMGYFSILLRHENPKGLAGGGVKDRTIVMLPRLCRDVETASIIVSALDPDPIGSSKNEDSELVDLVKALVKRTIMPSTRDSSDSSHQEAIHVKRLAHWLKRNYPETPEKGATK